MNQEQQPFATMPVTTEPQLPMQPPQQQHHNTIAKILAAVSLCFVTSFFGAWAFIGSGIVPNSSSGQNAPKTVVQESEIVAEVAKKVSPSVVSIVTESYSSTSQFFTPSLQEGAGTGIIISSNGYIITNKHVVSEGTTKVAVITADGARYDDVTVVGRDPLNDIAFLKVNGVKDFQQATLGDSGKVDIGQKVIAIGNALGQYQNSVTSGIISGIGRPVLANENGQDAALSDLLQTDAAINPGNSGGPLVNVKGEVIGINTAIIENAQGIGFALPINATKGLRKSVLDSGKLKRAYIGVQYITLTPEVARELKLGIKYGAYVGTSNGGQSVVPGGPAAKAGIRNGDIVTQVGETAIDQRNSLATLLAQHVPGDKVTLTLLRDGRSVKVDVLLTEYRG
jgi:serine protease Do